jgi:hypothetical protein
MMMKSVVAIGVIMVMLLAVNLARSEDCGIVNPSFEDDGAIGNIVVEEPNGWTVDIPDGNFVGYIYTDWRTEGFYSLTLFTKKKLWLLEGDTATVSQQMDLAAVSEITFDVKLDTAFGAWDPTVCSAVLLIDGDVVWQSNSVGSDVRGVYLGQVYAVEEKYRTAGLHTLSLGMRMNMDKYFYTESMYKLQWDNVGCSLFCGGAPLLKGDINRDCCVDANDLKLLAETWLGTVDPNDPANLSDVGDDPNSSGGIISFLDFAIYAGDWDGRLDGLKDLAANWLKEVDLDYAYNLFNGDDTGGIINFFDFAVLGDAWLSCSSIEDE